MSSIARSFADMNGKEPPRTEKKKKKKPSPVTEPTSISSLPYELVLICLARVSRLYYPTLSLVSKNFRSILASPELYQNRSLLDRTERCLYLCLRNTCWFTLYQKPNQNLTKKSTGNRLVQIPSPHIPHAQYSSLVTVGSDIYKISGDRLSVLGCRSHTWHQSPNMQVDRSSSSTASLVDGKIYVAGGCEDRNSLNWIEVFDPKTQTWGSVPNPSIEIRNERELNSLGLEGKFYLFGKFQFVVYNPKEGKWNSIGMDSNIALAIYFSHGVIDNVLFIWYDGTFKWYDCKVSLWKDLKGVEGLPDLRKRGYWKMVDLGGKMAVLWDEFVYSSIYWQETKIWCAEIALERRHGDEIWGKVEWFDVVLTSAVDVPCGMWMLFLLLFDVMTTHENG